MCAGRHRRKPKSFRQGRHHAAMQVINFRQSGVKQLWRCPKQYEYEHLLGHDSGPASGKMFAGTANHRAIEITLTHKIKTGELPPADSTGDIFVAAWKECKAQEEIDFWDEPEQKLIQTTYPGFAYWRDQIADDVAPVACEVKFLNLTMPGDITLEGTIDCIERGGKLRDWKTSGRKWTQADVNRDIQATIYGYAYRDMYGHAPASFDFEVFVRGNEALHQRLGAKRTDDDYDRLVATLGGWADMIRSGTPLPAKPDGWWCSKTQCPFWNLCPSGGGPISIPVEGTASPGALSASGPEEQLRGPAAEDEGLSAGPEPEDATLAPSASPDDEKHCGPGTDYLDLTPVPVRPEQDENQNAFDVAMAEAYMAERPSAPAYDDIPDDYVGPS